MFLIPFLLAFGSLVALPRTAGTIQVSDTTGGYVSRPIGGSGASYAFETAPVGLLGLRWKRAALGLNYAPRLTIAQLARIDGNVASTPTSASGNVTALLHNASANLSADAPRYSLGASYSLMVGKQYMSNLVPPPLMGDPAVPIDPGAVRPALLPAVQVLNVLNQVGTVRAGYHWTRRTRTDVFGSYASMGGNDRASRAFLPQQHTFSVTVGLGSQLTRRHLLFSSLVGTYIRAESAATYAQPMQDGSVAQGPNAPFASRYRHRLAGWVETLESRWSPILTSVLSAGAQLIRSNTPNGVIGPRVLPSGSASLNWIVPVRGGMSAGAQLGAGVAPVTNMLTGELQLTGQASAAGSLRVERTTMVLGVGALKTFRADVPAQLLSASLQLKQNLSDWFALYTGARVLDQRIRGSQLPAQWAVSAGIALQSPTYTF